MLSPPHIAHPTIASHTVALQDRASDILNLRIALDGSSFAALVRALRRLEGVRVTERPERPARAGHARCYLVHVLGFQMILTAPAGEGADFAVAVVSRTAQAALAVVSDLGNVLERLMSEPATATATLAESEPALVNGMRPSSGLRRSALQPGQPLARRTELRRKTPLARGSFKRS